MVCFEKTCGTSRSRFISETWQSSQLTVKCRQPLWKSFCVVCRRQPAAGHSTGVCSQYSMTWSCTLTRWSTHWQPVRLLGQRTTSSSSMVSTILGTGRRSLADSTGRRQVGQVFTGCCWGAQACSRHSRQKMCSQGSWTGRSKGAWQIRHTRFGSGSVAYSRAAISGGTLRHLLLRRFDEGELDARSAKGEGLLGGPPTTRNSDGSDSASASFDARELRRSLDGGMGDGDDMAIASNQNAEKQCGAGAEMELEVLVLVAATVKASWRGGRWL
jgi:hypothetical protein